jgi:AraC family transcriptional regulator
MNSAVERAIYCMWKRYSGPLSLHDIAQSAILSRFHFSRIFKEATGVSPGRYLSAVRIYQAKRMLVTTPMKVTDISFAVGFDSLGSFTNHFTDSVGISPSRFRRMVRDRGFEPPCWPRQARASSRAGGMVAGAISLPEDYRVARVYLGAFSTPIVQGSPASAVVADVISSGQPSRYRLADVPEGMWFIHAVAVADSTDPEPWTRRSLLVGDHEAVTVVAGVAVLADISLRPKCATDLPILLALPDLEAGPDGFAQSGIQAVSVASGVSGRV